MVAGRSSCRDLSLLRDRRPHRVGRLVERQHRRRVRAAGATTRSRRTGIGAYIAQATAAGDYPQIVLGIAVMSVFVILFNRLLWRPLYAFAERRLRLD